LRTARSYVKLLSGGHLDDGGNGLGSGASGIGVNAQVQGLGPKFLLRVELHNGGNRTLSATPVGIVYDHGIYQLAESSILVPLLLPGLISTNTIEVECLDENAPPGVLRIVVLNRESSAPVASATVNMPRSELLETP